MSPEGGGGAHAAGRGDLFDGDVSAFKQILGSVDSLLMQPHERRHAQLRAHSAGELPGAQAGFSCEITDRDCLVKPSLCLAQHGSSRSVTEGVGWRTDVAVVPAMAFLVSIGGGRPWAPG